MRWVRFGCITGLAAGLLFGWTFAAAGRTGRQDRRTAPDAEPIVLQFATNKAALDERERSEIRRLANGRILRAGEKIIVVGLTDASGDRSHNYTLSYRRAQAVRHVLIRALNADPDTILAVGRGTENPVADNDRPEGRVLNRRVEIYRVRMSDKRWDGSPPPIDAEQAATIETLVHRAQDALRRKQLRHSLQLLQKARALGGERMSAWHTAFGISGYYANAPASRVKAHLMTALRMDPFDRDARDYLGRLAAREKVAQDVVAAGMGKTPQNAIPVESDAQAYEYLRLFQVEPFSRVTSVHTPLVGWRCRDDRGRPVVYYFDRSGVLAWAFASDADAAAARPAQSVRPVDSASMDDGRPADRRVWNSRIFK